MSKNNKKSFVLYADMIGVVQKLPDEKAGQLLKLILAHVNGEEFDVDDLMLDIAFEPIKAQLTRDAEKWANTCKARSEAGKKGGRPKKQSKAKKPIASFEKQSKAKKADNDNDNDSETVNVNVTDTKHRVENLEIRLIRLLSPNARREELNKMEASSLSKVKRPLEEHDMELLEYFFALDKSKDYDQTWKRKQSLVTILNNLEDQLDLAYEHKQIESKKHAPLTPKHIIYK